MCAASLIAALFSELQLAAHSGQAGAGIVQGDVVRIGTLEVPGRGTLGARDGFFGAFHMAYKHGG